MPDVTINLKLNADDYQLLREELDDHIQTLKEKVVVEPQAKAQHQSRQLRLSDFRAKLG